MPSDQASIIELAKSAAAIEPRVLRIDSDGPAQTLVALVPDGFRPQVLSDAMRAAELKRDRPRQRAGEYVLHDARSFRAFIERHRTPDSVVFADPNEVSMTAVFDFHPAGDDSTQAGWGRFCATYGCPLTEAWQV